MNRALKKLFCTFGVCAAMTLGSTFLAYADVPEQVQNLEDAAEPEEILDTEESFAETFMDLEEGKGPNDVLRETVAEYALSFLGGRYKDAGNDPHTGVDCSGFVKYVLQHAAGVTLERCSRQQAQQGETVTADQMRPGDLIFYAKNGRINHVAMYIGNGTVVHASTYKTGIKTSAWNYRTPVVIKNMLGD